MTDSASPDEFAPARPDRRRPQEIGGLVADRWRTFGPGYVAATLGWIATRWLPRRFEDAMLTIEGSRGVLGPAHRRWTQHSVTANREMWGGWDWRREGEEWTASPGWKASVVEHVLEPHVPAGGTILEIGPGAGRWTEALYARATQLVLVDITDETLDLCRQRLSDPPNVRYVRTDGTGLEGVEDSSVDALWSFDAFVHIAPLDVQGYLRDMQRVLRAGAPAVVHHTGARRKGAWRSPMTGPLFASLARDAGLTVERQFARWDGDRYGVDQQGDVITLLRQPAA